MKTVFLLFDSLNLKVLENYGSKLFDTPNFNRLGKKTIKFNKHFVGSMPCMPARRDLQSGRLSFFHRGWGPLEPFDNSFTENMKQNNIYSHLISDHYHYFEDGGSTYHNRYNSFEFIRGQERDPWKAMVEPPLERFKKMYHKKQLEVMDRNHTRYFYPVNREYIKKEKDFPSVQCFNAGLEFLKSNRKAKNWFLQIETFDPHEPFFAPKRFKNKFKNNYRGPILDWPQYGKVNESTAEISELRNNYFALVLLCDFLLGSVLDIFDEFNLWNDTALILTTDHGFMLGEHDWWGKGVMPMYNEIAHIPLFFYHPKYKNLQGTENNNVTQNIDLMPTFLDFYNLPIPKEVQGISLIKKILQKKKFNSALYGYWGSGINFTDGEYTFFWYPDNINKQDLYQYTLMPMYMRTLFPVNELKDIQLSKNFNFTKKIPLLKIPYKSKKINFSNTSHKSLLYNLKDDPNQINPLNDMKKISEIKNKIILLIKKLDAPKELIKRFKVN